jgi:hypothetical protein
VKNLSKALIRIGIALPLLPILFDLWSSRFNFTKFFQEYGGGAVLWLELVLLPLGLVLLLLGFLLKSSR